MSGVGRNVFGEIKFKLGVFFVSSTSLPGFTMPHYMYLKLATSLLHIWHSKKSIHGFLHNFSYVVTVNYWNWHLTSYINSSISHPICRFTKIGSCTGDVCLQADLSPISKNQTCESLLTLEYLRWCFLLISSVMNVPKLKLLLNEKIPFHLKIFCKYKCKFCKTALDSCYDLCRHHASYQIYTLGEQFSED